MEEKLAFQEIKFALYINVLFPSIISLKFFKLPITVCNITSAGPLCLSTDSPTGMKPGTIRNKKWSSVIGNRWTREELRPYRIYWKVNPSSTTQIETFQIWHNYWPLDTQQMSQPGHGIEILKQDQAIHRCFQCRYSFVSPLREKTKL